MNYFSNESWDEIYTLRITWFRGSRLQIDLLHLKKKHWFKLILDAMILRRGINIMEKVNISKKKKYSFVWTLELFFGRILRRDLWFTFVANWSCTYVVLRSRKFYANGGDSWILRYGKLILNEMERRGGKKRCNEKGEIIIWLWSILKSMTRSILNKFYY